MVLQNELIDEDVEHFEDIPEDDEYVANPRKNEDAPAPSESDGNASDDANDLLLEGGQHNLKDSKPITDGSDLASGDKTARSTSPGGYNPRHREPLYWYFTLLCCVSFHMF